MSAVEKFGVEYDMPDVGRYPFQVDPRNLDEHSPSFVEGVKAAFLLNNPLANTGPSTERIGDIVDDYNPYDRDSSGHHKHLAGYEQYIGEFVDAFSPQEVERIKQRIDYETSVRKNMAPGIKGFLAELTAGLVDPANIVPIGGGAKMGAKAAWSAGKAALKIGGSAAALTASEEVMLHQQQVLRTYEESLYAVVFSSLFAGTIGGGARFVDEVMTAKYGRGSYKIANDNITHFENGDLDKIMPLLPQKGDPKDAIRAEIQGDLSRPQYFVAKTYEDLLNDTTHRAADIFGSTNTMFAVGPSTRLTGSISPVARETNALLNELSVPLQMNRDGVPTPVAAETKISMQEGQLLQLWVDIDKKNYLDYRKSGGKANKNDFHDAIGHYIMFGGKAEPNVIKAALDAVNNIITPLIEQAKKAGLVDADFKPDPNYFTRMWDRNKIIKNRAAFKNRVRSWLRDVKHKKKIDKLADDVRKSGGEKRLAAEEAYEKFDAELNSLETQITDAVVNGRNALPYWHELAKGRDKDGARKYDGVMGVLLHRDFDIPNSMIHDFLIKDADQMVKQYIRSLVKQNVMMQTFGDVDLTRTLKKIEEDYDRIFSIIQDDTNQKRVEKRMAEAQKQKERDMRDLEGARDRILGTYGRDVPDIVLSMNSAIKSFNVVTQMGMVTISSVADVASFTRVWGLRRSFTRGIIPMVKSIAGGLRGHRIKINEVRRTGAAMEVLMPVRAQAFADMMTDVNHSTRVEEVMSKGTEYFMRATGLPYWNQMLKEVSGMTDMNVMIDLSMKIAKGQKIGKGDTMRMADFGIDKTIARRIVDQVKKYGDKEDGIWLPNGDAWDDVVARDTLRAAIGKAINRQIITPGQEKPLFMSRQLGGIWLQFSSFFVSASSRIFANGLMYRDWHTITGMMAMLTMGVFSQVLRDLVTYGEIQERNEKEWLMSGILYSGVGGLLAEAIDRTQSSMGRNDVNMDAILGPTGTKAANLLRLGIHTGNQFRSEVSDLTGGYIEPNEGGFVPSDGWRIVNMAPLHNHPFLLWPSRWAAEELGEALAE